MVWSRGDSGRLVGPAVVLLIKFKKKYLSFHRGRHRLAATPVEGSKRTRRWTQEKVKLPEADGEVDAPAPLFTGKRLEQLGLATCWPPPCPALPCLKSRRCNASSRCLLDRLATCFVLLLIIIKGVANPPSRLVLLCRPHPSGALVRVPPPASSPSPSLPRENFEKVEHLWRLEGAEERLQLVKADLMEEGSFDDAVMGCEGVFHTASPVVSVKSDPKAEILDPSIKGTINVLGSCKKNPSLRRVVLTSSSSTVRVREDIDPKVSLDETSWSSVELCERLQLWYPMAKILAEKAAWEFARENEIDLVTVMPSFVVGPSLPHQLSATASDVHGLLQGDFMFCGAHHLRALPHQRHLLIIGALHGFIGALHGSPLHFLQKLGLCSFSKFLTGETERFSHLGRMGYVHIDDVANCHILVYEDAAAHGRHLCSSTVLENHELASLLAERYPSLPIQRKFNSPYGKRPYYEFNPSKLQTMGVKFKGIEDMFDDFIESLKGHGYKI